MGFNDFLKKIGFVDSLNIQMEIDKHEFARLLRDHVDLEQSDLFEAFSSSRNDYKGFVTENEFELKRKRRMFEQRNMYVKASGKFAQAGKQLAIDVELNGFRSFWIVYYVFLVLIYPVLFISFFHTVNPANGNGFPIPFIVIHAIFMFAFPYFYVRRSVSRMKADLERDLYFFTKK